MKIDLGIKQEYDETVAQAVPTKKETRINYPCIRIEISDENKSLLNSVPSTGDATVSFRVKSIRIGEDYFDKDVAGCIELEVNSIDFKGGKPMLSMDSAESLDSYMKNKKAKDATYDEGAE